MERVLGSGRVLHKHYLHYLTHTPFLKIIGTQAGLIFPHWYDQSVN